MTKIMIGDIEFTRIEFTRIDNDINGNPRYVCMWFHLGKTYDQAVQKAKQIGGKKYHNKQYGGGIVFQSHNLHSTAKQITELANS